MAPSIPPEVWQHDADADAHIVLAARSLQSPNHTQQVTLAIIGAYVVAIAILWNVPYLRMVLWPFKVGNVQVFVSSLQVLN